VLGESAVLVGEQAAAEAFFSEAVEVAERIGASLELGRSLFAHADFLAHRQNADRARAAQLALRACSVWSQIGLAAARDSALLLALECGARAPDIDPLPAHAVLSPTETTLLRRIAQGRAYAQIARELMIDPVRVTALVEILYAKLELDGPGLATAYALAFGIAAPAAAVLYESTVVMVTDMVDFTGMVQRMGDLAARRVVHMHNRVIRRNLAAHGGKEVTHTGDGMIAAFRAADEAIACAQSIQRELASPPSSELPISIRIGLNRGRVLPEEDRLFGAALIAAVRICARAQGGQVLLSESVCHSLADQALVPLTALGKVQLKGFDAPAEIYALAQ
jgi:class 3 adenylate cyclase